MTAEQQAAHAIKAEFPDVKVFIHHSWTVNGLGVELHGKRNAVAVRDDPEGWRAGAEQLRTWLRSVAKPTDASASGGR